MARVQKSFSIMVVLLSSLFIISISLSKDDLSDFPNDPNFLEHPLNYAPKVNLDNIPPEPSRSIEVPDPMLPPEPTQGYYKFLEDCSRKITLKCGVEVYTSIVGNEKISSDCCVALIMMGHTCHMGLTKLIMEFPEEKAIKSQILPRAEKAWNDYLRPTRGSLSPSS